MVTPAIAIGTELLLTIFQAWMLAAKQQGLTEEQAKEKFESLYVEFMEDSAKPIEEVKE